MKVLVIGAGAIGKRHHGNLLTLGVDSTLLPYSQFAEGHLASNTKRLDQWDGAVVATATHIRLEIVRRFSAAGVPLYIEKPLSFRTGEVSEITDAAGEIASRSMVGFMMRYHPAFRYLDDRDLADVYSFAFEIGHDVRLWRRDWRFAKSYAARAEGGGALLDLCHELDMALFLFPRAREFSVRCVGHDDYPGVDFFTNVQLLGASSPVGSVSMDYLSPVSIRRMLLRGKDVNFDFDLARDTYSLDAGDGAIDLSLACRRNDLFLAAMRDFLALIAGRQVNDQRSIPRLDLVADNCMQIARIWGAREFTGTISGEFA